MPNVIHPFRPNNFTHSGTALGCSGTPRRPSAFIIPQDGLSSYDFIASPKGKLREVCAFYGLECTVEYLDARASIVFPSPRRTRFKGQWIAEREKQ